MPILKISSSGSDIKDEDADFFKRPFCGAIGGCNGIDDLFGDDIGVDFLGEPVADNANLVFFENCAIQFLYNFPWVVCASAN